MNKMGGEIMLYIEYFWLALYLIVLMETTILIWFVSIKSIEQKEKRKNGDE